MNTFEDIVRERILSGTREEIPENVEFDPNDIEMFAALIYAMLRAGARREGQEGFQSAFAHFLGSSKLTGQPAETNRSEEELESIRVALIGAVERFSSEARALHVYFSAIEQEGASIEAATLAAQAALEDDLAQGIE